MAERAVGRPWTVGEDELLANAVAVHGQVDNWKAVALSVPGRTNKACRKRWLHSLSPSVKKTAWTKEEDDLLLQLYKTHSAKWAVIARNIPGRTDDACSKRYREALDPALKKDGWTPDEDRKLIAAYKCLGGKWGRVGQQLQRSGLGCRNRWRLLERKRMTAGDPQGVASANVAPDASPARLSPSLIYPDSSPWPSLPMTESPSYWTDSLSRVNPLPSAPPLNHPGSRNGVNVLGDPQPPVQHAQLVQQFVNFPAPFHYSSSSLSSALSSPQCAVQYEIDPEATPSNGCQSQVLPTSSVPPDDASTAVFSAFDYDSASSTSAISASSTSPAPHAAYTEGVRQSNSYNDCTNQFHQLQPSMPHMVLPVHNSSPVRPVQVDHYAASVRHEECGLSHTALTSQHQPTPQSSSFRAPSSTGSYFAPSQLLKHQGSLISSSITSVSLVDEPDIYYHATPEPQLDVNARHALIPSSDPLSLSESRPGYHFARQCDTSRARVMETMRSLEQHGECQHNHMQPDQSHHDHQPSRPPSTSPPETRYVLQQSEPQNANTHTQPTPSRAILDQYYASNPVHSSSLVRRTIAVPRSTGVPYAKRPLPLDSSSTNSEDPCRSSFQPISKEKTSATVPGTRPDAQALLRLSSDLQATPDPSVKPYACGHESCWPSHAASSRACYCTSRGLSDHNKTAHPEDSGGDKPYRCGLEGCGKSWKSINGLQYHLQISKAHFQHAITSTFVSSYVSGLSIPAASTSSGGGDKAKKQYKCPHENCPNQYKQLSGLRYHLAHGHPVELPKQLDLVPPALSRKLAEKMRVPGPAASSSERQPANNCLAASSSSMQGSFSS